ncbi:hypothetical protein ABB37_00046 [Leptomonas pyrrhocoris]|uniref:Uncharacterized protein n=1 Tax=Leptomonas pyrrhocoris TaxID=157538 RepID=A0A0N0DZS9_LEPPY|nr:hypothetical protein ABB37_00046 [Leptomonas pyrrhocoris]KPA85648.1 hypothetical protein ABB37_00046 [Leptomonas pyrrhocoris]|eukprot:XP_015664087.1 hypothetical protein ABB37_00046 [Leptomonas pyrrhocoris]
MLVLDFNSPLLHLSQGTFIRFLQFAPPTTTGETEASMSSRAEPSSPFTVPTTTNVRRRESARAVIQRLHATPVQLFPSLENSGDDATAARDQQCTASHAVPQPSDRRISSPATTVANADIKTELGTSSVCLLTTSAHPLSTATALGGPLSAAAVARPLRHYAYTVAAAHTLRGGRVLFLLGPASASFSLACFTLEVEQQWVRRAARLASPSCGVPDNNNSLGVSTISSPDGNYASLNAAAPLRARRQAVIEAIARVEVLVCASMADVYAVCHAGVFSSTASAENPKEDVAAGRKESAVMSPTLSASHMTTTHSPIAEANPNDPMEATAQVGATHLCDVGKRAVVNIIPLCVVEGLTGPTTTTTLQERATGQTFPIPHYLLCLLQRRLQCALLVVELPMSTVDTASGGRYSNGEPSRKSNESVGATHRTDNKTSLPSEEAVLADSDLIRRLRVPHTHPPPSVFASSTSEPETTTRRSLIGKAARREDARCTAECRTLPAVSLHNIHFCVLYVEVVGESRKTVHNSNTEFVCPVAAGLLSSDTLALCYRLHLMKTSLTDAPSAARGSSGRRSGVRQGGSGDWGSGLCSVRSSWRNSAVYAPTYSGTWVHSSEWHEY